MYGMTITLIACGGGENDLGNNGNTDSGITVVGSENTGNASESDGGASNNGTVNTDDADASVPTISATNPADYNWTTLASGTDVYIDRNYTYSTIPSKYKGFKILQTANDDKSSTGNAFISFNVDQPATIYIAHVENNTNLPTWLSSWIGTGEILSTNDRNLYIYKKDFLAGTIVLGGNGSAPSMYTVFVSAPGSTGSGSTGSGSTGSGSTGSGSTGSGSTSSGSTGSGSTSSGSTGSVSLSWTPPTTNADGSALIDQAGYRVRYGTTSRIYPNVITVTNSSISSYVIDNLPADTYYFVVTAFDYSGNESVYSNEVTKVVQ